MPPEMSTPLLRGQREPLANRRGRARVGSVTANVAGLRLHMHTATYPDGRLAELFIRTKHGDSTTRGLLGVIARLASVALQCGTPLETVVEVFIKQRFEPYGVVSDHDRIRMCNSVIDYVGRELAITFLGRDDLAHTAAAP